MRTCGKSSWHGRGARAAWAGAWLLGWFLTGGAGGVRAAETENHDFRVLPAPPNITIDGDISDWDLSAGLFACGELEHLRDVFALWLHAQHDDENIYILARWKDPTPLNNPGSFGGHGFNGDSLQMRFIVFPDTPDASATWIDGWLDRNGVNIVQRSSPGEKNHFPLNPLPTIPNASGKEVRQAFKVDPDGKGYTQEVAIPWSFLSPQGTAPALNEPFRMTFEPNFTAGAFGRITIKDLFDARVANPDRVFTWRNYAHWGLARRLAENNVAPHPVRLADGRTFPVAMQDGVPTVDWTGLVQRFSWPGFLPIAIDMPGDGRLSLNILDADGLPVRHLVNGEFFAKGRHTIQWDGLGDAVYRTPGQPLPAGTYSWKALVRPEVKLTFRGYASYGGRAPWQSKPEDGWLGDHGVPTAARFDGHRVYLACNGAEGGFHLLAVNREGGLIWFLQNTTGAYDPESIAADGQFVYVLHPGGKVLLTKVDAATGAYAQWEGRDTHMLTAEDLWPGAADPEIPTRIAAAAGRLYAVRSNELLVLDAASGKIVATRKVDGLKEVLPLPGGALLAIVADGRLVKLDADAIAPFADGLDAPNYLAAGPDGRIYVSEEGQAMRVSVFAPDGQRVAAIGRDGGRRPIGPWQADGMLHPAGLAVDNDGQLWVMERDEFPKRVSVWNTADGAFIRDFHGPTHYGAHGGAILPSDPNIMVGVGCEWRIDPVTGRAEVIGVFDRQIHGFATFREAEGQTLLYAYTGRYGTGDVFVYQRRGTGDYVLRARLEAVYAEPGQHFSTDGKATGLRIWIDKNADGLEQPDEFQQREGYLSFPGSNTWSLNLGPDLALYGFERETKKLYRLPAAGLIAETKSPVYFFDDLEELPAELARGYNFNYSCLLPDRENRVLLINSADRDHPAGYLWRAFDRETHELLWTYPNPFFQVHGSHAAPASDPGLFRGAYGPVGTATQPGVGSYWIINGNLGEWNILSSEGFYVSGVFSGNVFEWKWPDLPVPGVDMTRLPPGSGGEDFGGSMTQGDDGNVYIQAGKSAFWNLLLSGLEESRTFAGGPLELTDDGVAQARALREEALQAARAKGAWTVKRGAPNPDGENLAQMLPNAEVVAFKKTADAEILSAMLYDDSGLHVAWQVKDPTPWVNGSVDFAQIYAGGDTVDLQLSTRPDARRGDAAPGDLRLAIGPVRGTDTAVLYRFVSEDKKPRQFSSGVRRDWEVDYVDAVELTLRRVKVRAGQGYTVLVTIPWAVIGARPEANAQWRGDVGATHGDTAGVRTRLRTYWANQQTGLVDDVVFELMPTPKNWGDLIFAP